MAPPKQAPAAARSRPARAERALHQRGPRHPRRSAGSADARRSSIAARPKTMPVERDRVEERDGGRRIVADRGGGKAGGPESGAEQHARGDGEAAVLAVGARAAEERERDEREGERVERRGDAVVELEHAPLGAWLKWNRRGRDRADRAWSAPSPCRSAVAFGEPSWLDRGHRSRSRRRWSRRLTRSWRMRSPFCRTR